VSPVFRATSVALSGDGNTAIVGASGDSVNTGVAFVFTRSGGVWTQQSRRLVGTGTVGGQAEQGYSVALSADGNTAMVGGPLDNNFHGSAWVFVRNGVIWVQQGVKFSPLQTTGPQGGYNIPNGYSVALSADGNTAITGGSFDVPGLRYLEGAFVFTRSDGLWKQQGLDLSSTPGGPPSGPVANFGQSVSLSADGNTAMVGAPTDAGNVGAVSVFTRSGGVWSQQGSKLVGTGAVGNAELGQSVSLSAYGNTAIVGGPADNNNAGAAWIFTRSGGVWSQRGSKLVGTGAVGIAKLGQSVSLSADGNTAIAGGIAASWVFVQPVKADRTNTHDFNHDGNSDILWNDITGNVAVWLMNGSQVLSSASLGNVATFWSIVGQRDFDGDGFADILWRDNVGDTTIMFMAGVLIERIASLPTVPPNWAVVGTGDFNGDGKGDILWRDANGDTGIWFMNGATGLSSTGLGNIPVTWSVVGTGDFNGDGNADILWRDTNGNTAIWFMNGTQVASSAAVGNIPTVWSVVGTGDFNGDGMSDIVWQDTSGNTEIWLMNGATVSSAGPLGNVPTVWSVVLTGDYDGDGKSDLLWRDTNGNTAIWFMNGTTVSSSASVGNIPTTWTVQSVNAE
jgi:FG-GAP-like repeat